MMKSDKKMAILITAIMAVSVFAAMPVTQALIACPEPDLAWTPFSTGYDIPDVAIGDLTGNGIADVAFIDVQPSPSPPLTVYAVYGDNGTEYWHNHSVYGYSIAVGDVDDDVKNEVVAGGYNDNESSSGITVFEDNGMVKFFYETDSMVTDIEIGDIDNDDTNDIVVCDPVNDGWIYVINSTGGNVTGWPKGPLPGAILDIAIGNLDGIGGLDIAAISSSGGGTLYAFNSTGGELWNNTAVSGRSVEIGDVDGDTEEEVVIGNRNGTTGYGVYVYDGATGNLEYSFGTGSPVVEIELGDLDGDPSDLEIAALELQEPTLYALKVESGNPNLVEMWNFSICWYTDYYGEGLAIGDVDRDYKNEVIAASSFVDYPNESIRVYAFDGLDSNGDGEGDVVWMYEIWSGIVFDYKDILDIEVGDVDGDGDMDVIVGTEVQGGVYALFTQEHTAEVGEETIFFDSDPSNITDVASVDMPADPPSGYNFPYGVFAINITVPVPGQWAIITLTLPDNLPANSEYWKYSPNGNGSPSVQPGWYQVPLGSNDGDNVITITLQDGGIGDADGDPTNGVIVDLGGPANLAAQAPALTPLGIVALIGLLSIVATSTIVRIRKKS